MCVVDRGIYTYKDIYDINKINKLPESMRIFEEISNETLLIRLICGTLKISNGNLCLLQNKNYTIPGITENKLFSIQIIKDFFEFENFRMKEEKAIVDKYIRQNRRNSFVHTEILSELTGALLWQETSPVEAFVHIYRALEFMSYSFPLIYASKSMDYKGSYESLKGFLGGDGAGELKFLKKFLEVLFKNNILINYEFEIYFLSEHYQFIEQDVAKIIKENYYSFDGNTMKLKLLNMIDFITVLRNRYFHMKLGKGQYNFDNVNYDKRDIFKAVNPVAINWIALIYKEIVNYCVGIM